MHHNDDLRLNLENGLLKPIIYRPSPYHDNRPQNIVIDTIVIHCISLPKGVFGTDTVESFFCGQLDSTTHPAFADIAGMRVSAHLYIKRNGEVVQFVPFDKRAWHAGESLFQGRVACNDFSIGIELEGTDDQPYEQQQYQMLAEIINLLMKTYPDIRHDHIVGHEDIAPHRKSDPGQFFDWLYLTSLLSKQDM